MYRSYHRLTVILLFILQNFITAGEKNMDSTPFSLIISFSDNLEFTAALKNISDSTYKVHHHKYAAPIELTIISEKGDTLSFYDKRKKMRYHFKPDLNSFQTLSAQDSIILNRKSFEKESDSLYLLNWDAFVFRSIKPGAYTVTAQWRSRIDSYYDSRRKEFVPVDKVWKGTVVSNTITILLP